MPGFSEAVKTLHETKSSSSKLLTDIKRKIDEHKKHSDKAFPHRKLKSNPIPLRVINRPHTAPILNRRMITTKKSTTTTTKPVLSSQLLKPK